MDIFKEQNIEIKQITIQHNEVFKKYDCIRSVEVFKVLKNICDIHNDYCHINKNSEKISSELFICLGNNETHIFINADEDINKIKEFIDLCLNESNNNELIDDGEYKFFSEISENEIRKNHLEKMIPKFILNINLKYELKKGKINSIKNKI